MTDVPLATPVATPDVLLTVPMLVVPEVQLEDAVTSRDDPSVYVAVATNARVAPTGIEVVAGVTATETTPAKPKLGLPRIGSRPPSPPAQPATHAVSSNAVSHGRNLEDLSNSRNLLFICSPSSSDPKNHRFNSP